MKLALAAMMAGMAKASVQDLPSQIFYVPMPETDTFHKTFEKINTKANGHVVSMVALSISTAGTVVWYDHWEDGYDRTSGMEHQYAVGDLSGSTGVWGDGNCDNGYAPGTTCNNDSDDRLFPGQSIVLKSEVNVPSSSTATYVPGNGVFKYDGRDKILATFPIAVVRGNYPETPGSLMAGAIEMLDTREWGTDFISPVGEDMSDSLTNGFQHVAFYVMAKEEDTVLNFSDGTEVTLGEGMSYTHIIENKGESLSATKPVQVDLITGDESSTYELRWFSLLPRNDWEKEYFSPVGDTQGSLRILMYNPDPNNDMVVWVETVGGAKIDYDVLAGDFAYTGIIDKGSGASLVGDQEFIALSLSDTGAGGTGGYYYDWGFPILPTKKLTDEVLVGWGYGCTEQDCDGGSARSVVWVAPVANADIYIDINNSGSPDTEKTIYNAQRLSSHIIKDGTDISGAVIWAVKPGKAWNSLETVDIAAAWGQSTELAKAGNSQGDDLDLGTLIPAFHGVRVSETVSLFNDVNGDGKINPGDDVEYIIEVKNAGHKDYPSCGYKIKYPGKAENLPYQVYKGSCRFVDHNGNEESCADAALVDSSGLCSPTTLPKRGSIHYYKFIAQVVPDITTCEIVDHGILTQAQFGPDMDYSAPELVHFNPNINIEKTVWEGAQSSCSTGSELVTAAPGSAVTFCYEVTNTGDSWLDDVTVTDPDVNMSADSSIGRMAPGETKWVKFVSTMPDEPQSSDGHAEGEPVLSNGDEITTYSGGNVSDQDDAGVEPVVHTSTPSVNVEKTVHYGNVASCFAGGEVQYGFKNTAVTYCYAVTNTGDVKLTVQVTDGPVGTNGSVVVDPGQTKWVRKASQIVGDLTSPGDAVGVPEDGSDNVHDSDDAGVIEVADRAPCV